MLKFASLLLAALAPSATLAGGYQTAHLSPQTLAPYSLCHTSDTSSDWYCVSQCSSRYFTVSSNTFTSGSISLSASPVSTCTCSLSGVWDNTTTASGTFYTANYNIASWYGFVDSSEEYYTIVYDTGDEQCVSEYSVTSGCLNGLGSNGASCGTGGGTVYISWYSYGIPVILVIIISSAVGTSIRYRRLRALRLAQAGYYNTAAAATTVVATNCTPSYTPTVVSGPTVAYAQPAAAGTDQDHVPVAVVQS